MRIITGKVKGLALFSPSEKNATRPTSDKVKEAMFSALQFDLENSRVLDLFAGSGQLGLEALSRGAFKVSFVEANRETAAIVRRNIAKCGFEKSSELSVTDARRFLGKFSKAAFENEFFDIVFLDPPYNLGILVEILPKISEVCKNGAKIVCEHEKDLELPNNILGLETLRKYDYGHVCVDIYQVRI